MAAYCAYGRDGPPFPFACRLVDAMGEEIPRAVFVETETGLVVWLKVDEHGDYEVDRETQCIRTKTETRPAPIRLVPV